MDEGAGRFDEGKLLSIAPRVDGLCLKGSVPEDPVGKAILFFNFIGTLLDVAGSHSRYCQALGLRRCGIELLQQLFYLLFEGSRHLHQIPILHGIRAVGDQGG